MWGKGGVSDSQHPRFKLTVLCDECETQIFNIFWCKAQKNVNVSTDHGDHDAIFPQVDHSNKRICWASRLLILLKKKKIKLNW